MASKRFRLRYMFWLDLSKDDENELAEQIEILKQERQFAETIRDGIRLICDLRAGRTERLFAMFPWIAAEVGAGAGGNNLAIQQELNRLWGAIAGQPAGSLAASASAAVEEEVELNIKAVKNGSSGKNFLSSLMNLQQ